MINFDGKEMQEEFEEAFGFPIEEITVHQAWWLTKFGKHIRGRCRNNSAFNNFMARNFRGLVFHEVTKEKDNGEKYKGLEILQRG